MYEEQESAGEFDDDPLRSATCAEYASTTNRICERAGIGRRKVALTKDVGTSNRGPTNKSRKIPHDRLDLWKFRHDGTVASSGPIAGRS